MEGCLLCLQNHKEYVGYIQANSTYWMELNVHNIIEKHLWSIECIQPYSWICNTCWKALFDFNNFYMMIKQRHNKHFETPRICDSFNDDKTIIECQYESEIVFEQNLPEILQRNTTDVITTKVHEIEKLENDPAIFVYEVEPPHTDGIFVNENVNCDEQQNNLLYNAGLTRNNQMSNQTSFNSNMEEEDLIAHVIYVNPTKGKRGRPRKNSKGPGRPPKNAIESTNDNLLESKIHITSFNSKSNLGRPAKNSEKYLENMKRLKRLWENRSTSRPIRKRKLPCKLLTTSGESSNSLAIKNGKLYAFVKTVGKRGRPRKVLLSNTSTEQIISSNTKGKRGRPRKMCINNLDSNVEQVDKLCNETVSSSCENNTSLKPKNKRGRPRKDGNENTTIKLGQKNEFRTNKMPSRPKRKRKLPRKYYTNGIEVTERFLIPSTTEETCSSVTQKPIIKSEPLEICDKNNPSELVVKRGRPKKHITNETDGTDGTENGKQVVKTEKSFKNVKTISATKRLLSKLKRRKPVRPYKDLMRNYIATSVRCMQIFKPKNTSLSRGDDT